MCYYVLLSEEGNRERVGEREGGGEEREREREREREERNRQTDRQKLHLLVWQSQQKWEYHRLRLGSRGVVGETGSSVRLPCEGWSVELSGPWPPQSSLFDHASESDVIICSLIVTLVIRYTLNSKMPCERSSRECGKSVERQREVESQWHWSKFLRFLLWYIQNKTSDKPT